MIVPDTNLLVFAYDLSANRHRQARRWWEAVLSGDEPVGIPWIVVLAFTRLLTHPTICSRPMTCREVRNCIEQWLKQPHVRLLSPTADTLAFYFHLLEAAKIGGNLCTDAMIAAHALESGGVVYSDDRDFGRFKELKWRNPLAGERLS